MNIAAKLSLRAQNKFFKALAKVSAGFTEFGRGADAAGKPWGLPLYLRGSKAMLAAGAKADEAGFSLWRGETGFPAPKWSHDFEKSSRVCGIDPPCSFQKAVEAVDAPWADPDCQADFIALFSYKARQIANDPLCSLAASWALARIPQSSTEIRLHFLENLTRLDPQWSQHKEGLGPVLNLLFSHPDSKKDLLACAHASAKHEAEMEKNAISFAVPENGPAPSIRKHQI